MHFNNPVFDLSRQQVDMVYTGLLLVVAGVVVCAWWRRMSGWRRVRKELISLGLEVKRGYLEGMYQGRQMQVSSKLIRGRLVMMHTRFAGGLRVGADKLFDFYAADAGVKHECQRLGVAVNELGGVESSRLEQMTGRDDQLGVSLLVDVGRAGREGIKGYLDLEARVAGMVENKFRN